MNRTASVALAAAASIALATPVAQAQSNVLPTPRLVVDSTDPVAVMVSQLDLERYKATIKGLTQFGDRRQGTKRNRDAVDWIEAQLKSYGCTNTERITYEYNPPAPTPRPAGSAGGTGAQGPRPQGPPVSAGGGRARGVRTRTGVNSDSLRQPDARLRALNAEPSMPGERQEVYCTK
ncbi:MAG: peptidase M28, partial [Gemmatimonas sp.]|nr:peptidase M28 [Gemmatimonas sp.]